jgi:hypothetical protein
MEFIDEKIVVCYYVFVNANENFIANNKNMVKLHNNAIKDSKLNQLFSWKEEDKNEKA